MKANHQLPLIISYRPDLPRENRADHPTYQEGPLMRRLQETENFNSGKGRAARGRCEVEMEKLN